MKPKFVVYECEECGRDFYREVDRVLVDDAENCHVLVKLVPEYGTDDIEEFPMCVCLGGDPAYQIAYDEVESEDVIE